MHVRTVASWCVVAALVAASGCAGRKGSQDTDDGARVGGGNAAPAATAEDGAPATYAALVVLDGRTGERVAWRELVDRSLEASVVMVGEEHDLDPAQRMAADLFAAIVAERQGAALSLEFFERDEQVHLDDYVAGLTTEEQ